MQVQVQHKTNEKKQSFDRGMALPAKASRLPRTLHATNFPDFFRGAARHAAARPGAVQHQQPAAAPQLRHLVRQGPVGGRWPRAPDQPFS